jgi:hypothetical protein
MKNIFALTVITFSVYVNSANAEALSSYTGVNVEKDCVVAASSETQKDAEIDFLEAECPGLGGYRVYLEGGDLRYGLKLGFGNKKIDIDKTSAFHDMGSEKIEWVYERTVKDVKEEDFIISKHGIKYLALIYRINYSKYDEKTEKETNTTKLIVTKLNGEKSCVVAEVEASDDMNAKAKAIAAKSASLECPKDQ